MITYFGFISGRIMVLILLITISCFSSVYTLAPVILCENDETNLTCPHGEVIDIIYSYYGRGSNPHICAVQNQGGLIKQNCYHENPYLVLKCNGQQVCRVHASNTWFGDPCFGGVKHLFVQYECIPKIAVQKLVEGHPVARNDEKTKLVCESGQETISCPTGRRINVHYSFYGRARDPSICFERNNRMSNCYYENLDNLNCQGRQSCRLHASNSRYGDPCPGSRKYLLVDYSCV